MPFFPFSSDVAVSSCSVDVSSGVPPVGSCPPFRVFEPWDLLRGRCVFRDRAQLIDEANQCDLSHWAPNCATFSRAREIPIPGVANPPRPVRSESFPEGIPEELEKMSQKSRKKLDDDTEMADLSAQQCLKKHKTGRFFTLEHPGRSLAHNLESWRELETQPGVRVLEYTTCMFEGSRRRKSQSLVCNHEAFSPMSLICQGKKVCDRTGLPHLKWRPTTSGGKVLQFTTGDEREYPAGFCKEYAKCASTILAPSGTFLEVFSGPNAPLSKAVAATLGETLRGGKFQTQRGVKQELQRISQLINCEVPPAVHEQTKRESTVESKPNRLSMLESGKQPGYGKRTQLIPDGLVSTKKHVREALKLEHPFTTLESLKEDHRIALENQQESCEATVQDRLRALASWRQLSKSQDILKLEDKEVPKLCLTGMPIVGEALESPFFEPYKVPAAITLEELLASSQKRRASTINRVAFMAQKSSVAQAQSIYAKTLKEVQKGTMGGPYSHEELVRKYGSYYNVIPSFGLEQGTDEAGKPKYRRIDDHTAGFTNLAATRTQRINMAMCDYLVVMVRAHYDRHLSAVTIGTEDMQGAYRQLALPDRQGMISVTAVYDPSSETVKLFTMHGQPFGAGHSVPNFYRLAEWACRVLVRGFNIVLDHFFDDYFYIDRPQCGTSASFCLNEGFRLLGLTLDPDKSQPPSEVAHVLGVAFNTQALLSERILRVQPKPSRKQNFKLLVRGILRRDLLPPSLAASVIGKFGFLCSTLFGKVGRFCTGVVRRRQYSTNPDHTLNEELKVALNLMVHIVTVSKDRTCTLGTPSPPAILYTDASDVPHRDPRFGIGGVLILQHPAFSVEYFSAAVPQDVVDSWHPRATYMGQLEALAAPISLQTWAHKLAGQRIIHFIDNDAVASSLVRGYSAKIDSAWIISEYWSLAASHSIDPYIDRVESKSNLADGPSRFLVDEMEEMHASATQAIFKPFHKSSVYECFKGECCAPARAVPVTHHPS